MGNLYNEDGTPAEGAMTPDELSEKMEELKETAKAEVEAEKEELQMQLEEAKIELEQAKADMAKNGDKDKNFKTLRETKENKEKEVEELKAKMTGLETEVAKVRTETAEHKLDEAIRMVAGDDVEMAKKVKYHFNSFAGVPETDEKFQERLNSATILATGGAPRSKPTGGAFGSGKGSPAYDSSERKTAGKFENPESSKVAEKMGLTPEEQKKQGLI
jgi:hypothetical protein